jgi:chemotaxis protein histidine kinase CheA
MKIIEEMISRPGPILLECQREMAERDVPFEETQAALVYEDDRRSEWDATTQSEARADRERLDAEAAAHEQEREAERLREQQVKDDRERKARSEEEARARERETEIQRLQEQQEVNDRDKKDWKERLAEAERKAAAQQEADEAHKRQMRDIQLQREKEERERKKLREDLARAEQLAKAERAKAEEALRKMEEAAARRRKLERDINAIESSPGWTPRFIIQNKTQVPLHIKMRNAALLHMPTSHQNDLLPGKLRAMHAISGFHGFEAYFRVRSNALTASGQALEGLGTAAYIIGTAALGAVFAPGWIAAVTIGAVCGRLWAEVQRQVDPDTPKASGFESNIKQGEDDSVFMSCKPDEDLQKFTEVQMLIMEATRQGKNMFLFRGPDFRLIRTTRLQICGGPSAVEVPSKGYTRYEFKRTTQPIRMERIGAFIVEG